VTSFGSRATCGKAAEDNQYSITVPTGFTFHPPTGAPIIGTGQQLQYVGLRPYSSPNCHTDGTGCPPSQTPVFSNIFAENTIGASSYNSLQVSLEKRFTKGFQTQIAYTWSKSIDQASSFEDFLDPVNSRRTRSLSLFDARHRFVASYYWELPVRKLSGFAGKALNGWALSGITQLQAGFPIRIQSFADENLTGNASGFSSPNFPDINGKFQRLDPRKPVDPKAKILQYHYYFQPLNLGDGSTNPKSQFATQGSPLAVSPLGSQGNSPRTVCCGPGFDNTDISLQKNTAINEHLRTEFRLDIFNAFNHTKFDNPDGTISDGSNFGLIQRAGPPRLMQVALKLFF
jgi:hypothetical protein